MAFSFGKNWLRYSIILDESRIVEAEKSLQKLLKRDSLNGLSFLDIGSGSGIFSIAAKRLGAQRVVALDRDDKCLLAVRQNVQQLLVSDLANSIEVVPGDVLTLETLQLGHFDIVYAWGCLHHTGAMWKAIGNTAQLCRVGGEFALSIYNRTLLSPMWLQVKRLYNTSPAFVRLFMVATLSAVRSTCRWIKGKHPFRSERGMSVWYDAVDWLGGLPYEYTSPGEVVGFLTDQGFKLIRSVLTQRSGCNEFVFSRLR